jgi:hypothetical protein
MKIATPNSKVEIVVQQIEKILSEHGVTLQMTGYELRFTLTDADKKETSFDLVDLDHGGHPSFTLPRFTESERLKLVE